MAEMAECMFEGLSMEEIEAITPLEVFLYVMRAGVRYRDLGTAMLGAREAAPYVHAKLAQKEVESTDEQRTVRVIGGLPTDEERAVH